METYSLEVVYCAPFYLVWLLFEGSISTFTKNFYHM